MNHATAPMVISRILIIKRNLVYVDSHMIPPNGDVFRAFPPALNTSVLLSLINTLHISNICLGNHDNTFITLARQKKEKFLFTNGQNSSCIRRLVLFCGKWGYKM